MIMIAAHATAGQLFLTPGPRNRMNMTTIHMNITITTITITITGDPEAPPDPMQTREYAVRTVT